MRYLICGATGFIGRNITERLGALFPGHVVGVYHNAPPPEIAGARWVQTDLRDTEQVNALIKAGDIIIQAAATTSGAKDILERPHIHTTDNAIMNSLLLRACYDNNASHFLFFSCPIVYPPNVGRALKEADCTGKTGAAHFPSAWTKIYIEKMCEFYAGLGKTRHTVIRHSNCYGPHDKYDLERSHMYGATVTKVMEAEEGGTITVWGPGTEGRDLLYIDDVVDFVVAALEQRTPFELVNIGCGQAHRVIDVVKTIIKASGKNIAVAHDLSKPHIPSQIWLDCSLAQKKFKWTPKKSLAQGTTLTLAWHSKSTLSNYN